MHNLHFLQNERQNLQAGRGVERHAGNLSQSTDRSQDTGEGGACLGVNGEAVRAGLSDLLQVRFGPIELDVNVERQGTVRPEGADHRRAEGEIREEYPILEIEMDHVCAGLRGNLHGPTKPAEVSGRYGRSDLKARRHGGQPPRARRTSAMKARTLMGSTA